LEVQEKRKQFLEDIKKIDIRNLEPLDESSANLAFLRNYGRAKKGERIKKVEKMFALRDNLLFQQ
ncbi:MAG: hypothetical protein ACRCUS_00065, partial [Anaerovoracaceae bacterium]